MKSIYYFAKYSMYLDKFFFDMNFLAKGNFFTKFSYVFSLFFVCIENIFWSEIYILNLNVMFTV